MNTKWFLVVVLIPVGVVMIGLAVYVQMELREKDAGEWTGENHTNSIGMDLVYIPPTGDEGFMMGTPERGESRRRGEEQHKVILTKGFYLQATEVTQKQWKAVMGDNPSHFKGDDLPVEVVSWKDARDFIRKLNSKEGTKKYRLPTEAEWEYACRAGTTTAYYWGDEMDGDYCWYDGNSGDATHPVGRKKPNAWGLYDMNGNVNEWCQDWYDYDYYEESPEKDPRGPTTGQYRVLRGGCSMGTSRSCRSARRKKYFQSTKAKVTGFRVLREAD